MISSSLSAKEKITLEGAASLSAVNIDGEEVKANSWTLDGTTAIYDGKATIKGVKSLDGLSVDGKTINLADSSLSKKVTVSGSGYTFDFASDYSQASITGSDSDDAIIARGQNISVMGDAGDDTIQMLGTGTLTGGTGEDNFIVNGSKALTISDYEEGEKISLTAGTADSTTDGDDLIFNGKVTVAGGANKNVIYIDEAGEHTIEPSPEPTPTPNPNFDVSTNGKTIILRDTYLDDSFDIDNYDEYKNSVITIDASAIKHSLEIVGNKLANSITGTGEDDFIDGQAGSDNLIGGKGNDSIWGGVGNDTIFGGKGADVFIYYNGDGKDVIEDYDPTLDTIMVLSGEIKSTKTNASGDVIFKIGSGQILVAGATDKIVTLVDPSGNRLSRYNPN